MSVSDDSGTLPRVEPDKYYQMTAEEAAAMDRDFDLVGVVNYCSGCSGPFRYPAQEPAEGSVRTGDNEWMHLRCCS